MKTVILHKGVVNEVLFLDYEEVYTSWRNKGKLEAETDERNTLDEDHRVNWDKARVVTVEC